ncbi:MAG: AAA family ATPase, partial [Bacteroidales bacterium]|nr:AAA family ATPase [Bacteroidales bacterium]
LSLQFSEFVFVPNETVLILDEIQDCPRARLALKSFKEDGRFEVIASGSYVGLNIEQKGNSALVGVVACFFGNGTENAQRGKVLD